MNELRAPVRQKVKRTDQERTWHFILALCITLAALALWKLNSAQVRKEATAPPDRQPTPPAATVRETDRDIAFLNSLDDSPGNSSTSPVQQWQYFAPKSKETCLREGSGKFDEAFFACRRGGKRLVVEQDGTRTVVTQIVNDYSKLSPEQEAEALARSKKWRAPQSEPAPQHRQSSSGNPVLATAESSCNRYLFGSAEYRECRGRTWRRLRDTCIELRGKTPFVKPELRQAHLRLKDDYCEAEKKYKIVD